MRTCSEEKKNKIKQTMAETKEMGIKTTITTSAGEKYNISNS
ncbi:MAG TPA: hypothetical protein PL110_03600 [Candidatus Eremiobacteraeota bacterium]|nr:hypothetical protein [Candidatus Eremiobacteraeota bacterium]